jgi:membrane-associated phospholipid phosphatase
MLGGRSTMSSRISTASLGCAIVVGAMIAARDARADEPRAPLPGIDPALQTPPNEPPAVPTPSPVVQGGTALATDRESAPLRWNFAPISAADYAIGGTAAAITLAAAIIHPLPAHQISGGILFDNAVQKAVQNFGTAPRYAFRDASNVGLSLAATWPFFADALATAWWYRGNRDVAQEMALLDLETLAIAGATQGVVNVLVSRQRPYGPTCGTTQLPSNAVDCESSSEYRSFFSGHATFSFTAAALVCVNHTTTDLLGSPWDGISCGAGYVVAAATSTFRVLGDEHWASDVITGALVGTIIGYGVPLLHYRHHDVGRVTAGGMTLQLVPSVGGAGVVGTF